MECAIASLKAAMPDEFPPEKEEPAEDASDSVKESSEKDNTAENAEDINKEKAEEQNNSDSEQ